MIWPFRQASSPAEAPLWSLLDACAIPFRDTVGTWAARFPLTASGKDDDIDYCIPDTQSPLFEGLDRPIRASVSAHTNHDAPPEFLRGGVQGDGDHRLNYAKAVARLSTMYGKGKTMGGGASLSRWWDFGLAQLTCTVLRPEDAKPQETYAFRDTVAEAVLLIYPAWCPALTEAEQQACAAATPLWTAPDAAPNARPQVLAHSRDSPRQMRQLPFGVAMTPQGDLLVNKPMKLTDIYLQGSVTGLGLNRFAPGPGGDVAYLYAITRPQGRDGPFEARHEIARCTSGFDGLNALADTLATRLSVPLNTWDGTDDYWPL